MIAHDSSQDAREAAARQLLLDCLDVCGLEDWQRLTIFAAASSYAKLLARRAVAESTE